MRRKIIVIGSNSFSGSDFIDLLLADRHNQVIGVSRSPEKSEIFLPYKHKKSPKFHFRQLDLNHDSTKLFRLIKDFAPEYIVNFAAQSEVAPSWTHPEHWFETNTVAIARLGNFLKDANYLKRYLHISSPEVYGTCKGIVTEDAPLNPSTPYAASKAAGDLFLFTLVKNYKFPIVLIRSTNVYGTHQQLFKIIPRTIINIKLGHRIYLHGGGKAIKSYIHIRDVSRGEYKAMLHGHNSNVYHLSPNKGIEIKKVVALICMKMGVDYNKFVVDVSERLGQDAAYVIDSSKARRLLKWRPQISLSNGIDGVIAWIEENWKIIKTLPHDYTHKP